MDFIIKFLAHLISIPARIKGMTFGKNSFIRPGYDVLFASFKGVVLGNNVVIGKNAWIDTMTYKGSRPKITVGDETIVGRFCKLSSIKKIAIGKKCLLSYNVTILDCDHKIDPDTSPVDTGLTDPEEVIIENSCFIGAHSFILKGVHLGKHCVVGANSVVTKSFPAYSVVAGNPARLIRKLK